MFYKPYPKSIELAERMRIELYHRWLDALEAYYEGYINDHAEFPDDEVGRPCTVKWLDGFGYPVLSVEYMGMLPHYDEKMKIKGKVRDMYQRAFWLAKSGIPIKHEFKQAHIYVIHYFPDRMVRDLDNRYTKFLIDNFRHAGFIPDDSWQHVSWTETGLLGNEAKVVLFVVDDEHLADFGAKHIDLLKKQSSEVERKMEKQAKKKAVEIVNIDLGKPSTDYPMKSKMRESLF